MRDSDLQALLPEFVDHWDRQLGGWWTHLREATDVAELRRFGHTVKGSFAQFGMADCAALGPALMACAASGEWGHADEIVDELRAKLAALRADMPPPRG